MKHWKTTLAVLAALSASIALADDFKTINGKEYKNARVSRVEPDGIVLISNWKIIADNLGTAGSSRGCVSAIDSNGRTIWIADAHRDNGKCFVVRADEKLTALMELESEIRTCGRFALTDAGDF